MPMRAYMACGDPTLKLEDFKGQDCILGVDLASKNDLACISHLFWDWQAGKKHWYCFVDHFLPEHAVKNAANKGVYDGWVRSGFITTTVGNVLDVDVLEDRTLEIAQNYNVTEIAFDPAHNSTQYGVHMERQLGEIVVEVRPSVLNFSEPMKWMEAWVVEKTWHHNGDPVMTWMVSNVEVKRDHKDGIFPRKQSYERKIDGLVATIAALNRAQAIDETPHFTGRLFVT
jgi:phage terminase large subunit-like protein